MYVCMSVFVVAVGPSWWLIEDKWLPYYQSPYSLGPLKNFFLRERERERQRDAEIEGKEEGRRGGEAVGERTGERKGERERAPEQNLACGAAQSRRGLQ